MSIWKLINVWSSGDDPQLFVLQPEFSSGESGRFVVATKDVFQEVYGVWEDPGLQERFARAQQVIDSFINNSRIKVRLPPSKSVKAQLALLEPPDEEIWEFRTEKPAVRVFGRFAEFNIFIALNTELRENIDDDFAREKEECKRLWRYFFQSYKPYHGTEISDYIDNFTKV
jgi:hypothetical protein